MPPIFIYPGPPTLPTWLYLWCKEKINLLPPPPWGGRMTPLSGMMTNEQTGLWEQPLSPTSTICSLHSSRSTSLANAHHPCLCWCSATPSAAHPQSTTTNAGEKIRHNILPLTLLACCSLFDAWWCLVKVFVGNYYEESWLVWLISFFELWSETRTKHQLKDLWLMWDSFRALKWGDYFSCHNWAWRNVQGVPLYWNVLQESSNIVCWLLICDSYLPNAACQCEQDVISLKWDFLCQKQAGCHLTLF